MIILSQSLIPPEIIHLLNNSPISKSFPFARIASIITGFFKTMAKIALIFCCSPSVSGFMVDPVSISKSYFASISDLPIRTTPCFFFLSKNSTKSLFSFAISFISGPKILVTTFLEIFLTIIVIHFI